jgi:hypothetical protein
MYQSRSPRCRPVGQVVEILQRDSQNLKETKRFVSAGMMLDVERVVAELLMDVVSILATRERLADLWWPGH